MKSNFKSKKQSPKALALPASKSQFQLANLRELAHIAQLSNGKLLSTQWRGATARYEFRHETNAVFTITGTALSANGWPIDLAGKQSKLLVKVQLAARGRASHAELYAEFRSQVELNHAEVISPRWLGAKVNHEIKLRDGSLKSIKPNQLKNYGWPAEPLVNLKSWAAANELTLLTEKWVDSRATYVCRLKNGMFVDETPAKLRAMVAHNFIQQCDEALAWAAENGVTLLTQHWQGLSQEYDLMTPDGRVSRMSLSAAMSGHLVGDVQTFYAIRRKAKDLNLTMVDSAWRQDGIYTWELPHGELVSCTWAVLNAKLKADKKLCSLREYGQGVNAILLSKTWSGSTSTYRWKMADGSEVVATKYSLAAAARKCVKNIQDIKLLQLWADSLGLVLISTIWEGRDAVYTWATNDGITVSCTQYALLDYLRKVKEEQVHPYIESGVSASLNKPCNQENFLKIETSRDTHLIPARKIAGAHKDKFSKLQDWSHAEGLVLLDQKWTGSTSKYTWKVPSGSLRTTTPAQMRHEIKKQKIKKT